VSLPANNSVPLESPLIAGSVLPIQRAEELLATLPSVISARIVAGSNGAVEEIHILTTTEVTPKQTVRNVESALIAHLGMRVSHKKISVAMSDDSQRNHRASPAVASPAVQPSASAPVANTAVANALGAAKLPFTSVSTSSAPTASAPVAPSIGSAQPRAVDPMTSAANAAVARRRYYFEDVEVRRSRSKGVACRVTLSRGDQTYVGESEGFENERLRIELAARATLSAIMSAEGTSRVLVLEGCRTLDAFDREFVFVGITTREGRESYLMTGSAEIRESPETSSVLAVLDATNRWLERSDR
jgi:hypothetical protein